ncbi:hypothetical protein BC937DRAFT_91412 [Endogone sp. FLAS-F59071]|nr:hypothetical protein BC937DRAFT_91412 [Endogone sp. FLAS-F59071]|eukprot:RUS16281.1 hypothetical protein BC937DRAFT_91412 [Endogone sp. FLAS-F59071]
MSRRNDDEYDGLTEEEEAKISYWADWVELNTVAPPSKPLPPDLVPNSASPSEKLEQGDIASEDLKGLLKSKL